MTVDEFLKKVAYKTKMVIADETVKVWKSKYDDSFLTIEGLEDELRFLADREITENLSSGLGFSPKEEKWYGWSHRAICGFKIGSTCLKGDCHYKAANLEDEIEKAISFWKGDGRENVKAKFHKKGEIEVTWDYIGGEGGIRKTIWYYDKKFGKGEWIAETMEDARQMAIDFKNGVS